MKCIRMFGTKQIFRTTDEKAQRLVDSKEAVYANKQSWKSNGRKYLK